MASDPFTPATQRPKTIANAYIKRLQRRHFWLYNLVPFVGSVAAVASLFWFPIGLVQIGLLVGMWAVCMIGMSLGLHRYFAHGAYKTGPKMHALLAVLGCMSAQGPLVSWVAVHRRHHERSDKPGDPHSPNPALRGEGPFGTLRGLWHAHVGWLTDHEYPSPVHYAPDLLRDRTIARINRHYSTWVALGLLIPTVLGGILLGSWMGALQGLLWGGAVRMFVVDNSVLSINSFSHVYGSYDFQTNDNSRNNPWVAVLTFGESWQNNHHAFPSSAAIGLKWWQLDLGYWIILALGKVGLVWDVNRPSLRILEAKTIV